MNTNAIINDYVEAVAKRAYLSASGGSMIGLEIAMGHVYETLKALKLQSYELEVIQKATKNLLETNELIAGK